MLILILSTFMNVWVGRIFTIHKLSRSFWSEYSFRSCGCMSRWCRVIGCLVTQYQTEKKNLNTHWLIHTRTQNNIQFGIKWKKEEKKKTFIERLWRGKYSIRRNMVKDCQKKSHLIAFFIWAIWVLYMPANISLLCCARFPSLTHFLRLILFIQWTMRLAKLRNFHEINKFICIFVT